MATGLVRRVNGVREADMETPHLFGLAADHGCEEGEQRSEDQTRAPRIGDETPPDQLPLVPVESDLIQKAHYSRI